MTRAHKLLFIVTCSVGVACGASTEGDGERANALLLQLAITDGVEVDEVAWRVSGNMEDMMGTIDTSDSSSTASIELFGLAEGTGYLVEMEALTVDGDFFCAGASRVDVVAGGATPVEITLSCIRQCGLLVCPDPEADCQVVDLPDGSSCADDAGSCMSGSCELTAT